MQPTAQATLKRLEDAGCNVAWHNVQNKSVRHGGRTIGGWNDSAEHWYILDSVVSDAMATRLERLGFVMHRRASGFRHWQLDGAANGGTFREAIGDIADFAT